MPHSFVRKHIFLLFCFLAVISLPACELTQNYLKHDRENNMEPQDYRDALAPRVGQNDPMEEKLNSGGRIPELQPYVAQTGSNQKPFPLVSISVNQTIPLRDVLYEIASQASYDVELDPRIEGSIIFSARNRPLDMVIDRISEIAGLRYKFEDDMLRVEIDTPYHEIYKVNYLALTRTNSSTISNDISVVSGGGGDVGGDTDTGSSFSATNESTIDFWGELETNLTQILESNRDSNRLATERDPQVTVADVNPAPVQPLMMDDQGNIVDQGPNVQVAPPDAVLNVDTLPVEDENLNINDEDPFAARFSVNRQAGLISVFAPERLHKKVSSYMKELQKSVTSQVLVEAKVLEVSLSDEFSAGIDWSQAFGDLGGIGFGPQSAGGLVRGILDTDGTIPSNGNFNFSQGDFDVAVDALSRFGTVQALASPRLTVLNNQSAALNVARNVVYFEIDAEVTTGDAGAAVESLDTNARTVPEGVLINVQPAIDLDRELISMAIRPTVTSIVDFTNDPNPALVTAGVESPVPVVNVQEFDSVIQMNNGQAVILGGLIQDRISSTRNSIPVLGEVPMFGGLFRNQEDIVRKTELVVFLKATIVDHGNFIHPTDKDLYRTFSSDRRPFRM
jgi:general secretion pathway protein D